uniref:SGNH domain-containing protein n=1 Tax=Panagrolaimus sp. PS1159 TaxID=55785 RepID=A0AC35G5H6_9BILA
MKRLYSSLPNIIEQNEIEAKSCQKFYYDSCEQSPILDKYLTVRPKSEKPERYCSYKLNPSSNKIIMITGNSLVYFQIRGILDAIKESKTQFKEAFFITHPACSIIAGKLNYIKKITCENFDGSFDALLNATKPDIIIHSSRFKNQKIKTYQNPLTIAHTLQSNGSISSFNVSIERFHETQDPTWNRVKKAVESCLNCILIPTQNLFCQKTHCPAVDRRTQLGMYCDLNHLTPRYSLCLKPNILEAIDFKKQKMNFNCDLSVLKIKNKF